MKGMIFVDHIKEKKTLLELENLSIGYNATLISEINLKVYQGEIISIIGPSGIGKTTLLRTIAQLIKPLSGNVISNVPKRGGVGYIPQRLGLVRHMNVEYNVGLGAKAGTPLLPFINGELISSERKERTNFAINTMRISDKRNEPVRRLSGGQQRRVATARALAQKPQIILADEFLSELDEDNITIVLNAVNQYIGSNGAAMILVEHNIERARQLSTSMFKMSEGKLIPLV